MRNGEDSRKDGSPIRRSSWYLAVRGRGSATWAWRLIALLGHRGWAPTKFRWWHWHTTRIKPLVPGQTRVRKAYSFRQYPDPVKLGI